MVSKNIWFFVLWTKLASALEGLYAPCISHFQICTGFMDEFDLKWFVKICVIIDEE